MPQAVRPIFCGTHLVLSFSLGPFCIVFFHLTIADLVLLFRNQDSTPIASPNDLDISPLPSARLESRIWDPDPLAKPQAGLRRAGLTFSRRVPFMLCYVREPSPPPLNESDRTTPGLIMSRSFSPLSFPPPEFDRGFSTLPPPTRPRSADHSFLTDVAPSAGSIFGSGPEGLVYASFRAVLLSASPFAVVSLSCGGRLPDPAHWRLLLSLRDRDKLQNSSLTLSLSTLAFGLPPPTLGGSGTPYVRLLPISRYRCTGRSPVRPRCSGPDLL